jgi:PIN domain nuclease of toxin-antitoxin system
MDCLLDTHTLIWFLNGDGQLSKKALNFIENLDNKKYVSIVSFWEISIKIGLKKLEFDGDTREIIELAGFNDFEILPISFEHIIEYEGLEFIHRDPFDRMLVAQAMVDNLTVLTKDENICKYKVKTKW